MNQKLNYEMYILRDSEEDPNTYYKYILISYYGEEECYFISTDYIKFKILDIKAWYTGSLISVNQVKILYDETYRNRYNKIGTFNVDELIEYFIEEFI